MNVLVYSGVGTTVESVRHVLYSLRRILSPYYSIIPVTSETLLKEPWQLTCSLIVVPGGADLGYCRVLNGEGNRRINQFVRRGGAYLGFCAGGYYGAGRVEFEVDDPNLAVVGSRELAFFDGPCRGGSFKGFSYASEHGAKAANLKVELDAFKEAGSGAGASGSGEEVPETFVSYYNGGGVFVGADKLAKVGGKWEDGGKKVTVLARYLDPLAVEGGDAAVVHIKVGEGNVVLTGPHPEFAGVNLDRNAEGPDYHALVDAITQDHEKQVSFLKACLVKLGLKVSEGALTFPKLTPLHLTSMHPEDVGHLVTSLEGLVTKDGDKDIIRGENDAFYIEQSKGFAVDSLGLENLSLGKKVEEVEDKIIEYDKVVKTIYTHSTGYPNKAETPYFNHESFYKHLGEYRSKSRSSPSQFGSFLLYGEVVTSTSTMLDKNYSFLEKLPSGLTSVATMQVAGRGRGSNVWVSPIGGLVFSTIIRHPMELSIQAPVVFIQYLTALAIIEGIKSYGPGYSAMPVKLKWPNDIYALDPNSPQPTATNPTIPPKYVKIGGILVTSTFSNNQFHLVIGVGINTTNKHPTTSLNSLVEKINSSEPTDFASSHPHSHSYQRNASPQPLASFQPERLLSRILVVWEEFYSRFVLLGFRQFEDLYYSNWLHSGQIVRLEMEGGVRARIKGITLDHGLLVAEEVNEDGKATGKSYALQSDGNSFDFLNGLLKTKL